MTLLDSSGFDPDDERLSRYLDDDLPDDERRILESDLQRDPRLASQLAGLRLATAWLGVPAERLSTDELNATLDHALRASEPRSADSSASPDDDLRRPTVVAPMRPRRSHRWSNPAAWGLSVAAALVAVVAVGALLTRSSGDDGASDGAVAMAATSTEIDAQRHATDGVAADQAATESGRAAAVPAQAADAEQSATSADGLSGEGTAKSALSSPGEPEQSFGAFDSVDGLLDAIAGAQRSSTTGVRPLPSTAPATTPSTAEETSPTAPASSASEPLTPQTGSGQQTAACLNQLTGTAVVAARNVRWGFRGDGSPADPRRIVVVDAEDCSLLGERPT